MKTYRKLLLIFALLVATMVRGQGFAIDPTKPADASEVEITAANVALFDKDVMHIVGTDELEPAMARRAVNAGDVTDFTDEGKASIPKAYLYSYKYPSVDADGNRVMLSSLMAVPTEIMDSNEPEQPSNVVIGCHVTITSNFEAPTEYNRSGGVLSWKTDVGMQICYTRNDWIRQPCCLVIMPDYEGYGATKGRAHPYLYQELTARQVVDDVRYGLAYYNANKTDLNFKDFKSNWQTVCVGYSQGGSVSLATHRFIEENGLVDELHFAGSVCGDGPYDPLEHMRYYMQDEGETYVEGKTTEHEKETVSMPIVMPLILKGMCDRNPFMRQHKVSDYLTTDFLCTGVIDWINAKSEDNKDNVTTVNFTELIIENGKYNIVAGFPQYIVIEEKGDFTLNHSGETYVGQVNAETENGQTDPTDDTFLFKGTTKGMSNAELYGDGTKPAYILQSDGNWHKVPQNQPKAFVAPFRAYFQAKEASNASKLFTGFGDDSDATSINQTVVRTTDRDGTQHYYNLNGHRINGKPENGMYILNGKTYINK